MQNMFRIDEYCSVQNRVARKTTITDVQEIMPENCVYTHPTVIHEDTVKNFGKNQVSMSLSRGLIYPLRENPYFSA